MLLCDRVQMDLFLCHLRARWRQQLSPAFSKSKKSPSAGLEKSPDQVPRRLCAVRNDRQASRISAGSMQFAFAVRTVLSFMASCCRSLSQRDVCWSIENPTRSLLWQLPRLKHLVQSTRRVEFDACMFGSMRRKRTAVLSNKSWFQGLAQDCSGGHRHLPWEKRQSTVSRCGPQRWKVPTPRQLSSVWASLAAEQCSEQLLSSPMSRKRKRKLRFEPDFSDKLTLDATRLIASRLEDPGQDPPVWTCFPKGSKLVQWIEATQQAVISIPLRPLQWVRRAYLIAHPSLDAEEVPCA